MFVTNKSQTNLLFCHALQAWRSKIVHRPSVIRWRCSDLYRRRLSRPFRVENYFRVWTYAVKILSSVAMALIRLPLFLLVQNAFCQQKACADLDENREIPATII